MRTCGEGLLQALTTSQVHHEELAYFDALQGPLLLPWGCSVSLDDGQHDYGMAATGVGIQPCECKHPASPVCMQASPTADSPFPWHADMSRDLHLVKVADLLTGIKKLHAFEDASCLIMRSITCCLL